MRTFAQLVLLIYLAGWGCKTASTGGDNFQGFDLAKKHGIDYNKPAVDFFEGALLGNGGMGVVVTTRPDGVMLYFGHNNVWDIRIAENHREEIGDFHYVFDRVSRIPDTLKLLTDDPWYKKYSLMAQANYRQPHPVRNLRREIPTLRVTAHCKPPGRVRREPIQALLHIFSDAALGYSG